MVKKITLFLLIFAIQLRSMELVKIYNDDKKSQITLTFLNQEKTHFQIYNLKKMTPETSNKIVESLGGKEFSKKINALTIRSSNIDTITDFTKLFTAIEMLTIQNCTIRGLSLKNYFGLKTIIITNNSVSQSSLTELVDLKDKFKNKLIEGSNKISTLDTK